ncbi:peptidoglycan-binding domain-containing protein [Oryzibacter oryziterrae]|uniref:peptidoglycan-binding domain-containing protein n=1 Tax=Oryzibacter oryziterrae TaxID=2766474 RepID=UPI001F23750E|nr:peptidoglycan-binding domain-containing protein [Oryzibacter oryziterrae]
MARSAAVQKPSVLQGVMRLALGNPMATVGGLVMATMATAIITNALALQRGMHPAPLFYGTSPFATSSTPHPAAADSQQQTQTSIVIGIQQGLAEFGYYKGSVDGLPGPQTSQAILAFERAFGLAPTGEASDRVLSAIRTVQSKTSGATQTPVVADPITVGTVSNVAPVTLSVPIPLPKPGSGAAQPSAQTAAAPQVATPTDNGDSGSIANLIAATLPGADPVVAKPVPHVNAVAPVALADTGAPAADAGITRIQQSLAAQGFGPLAVTGQLTDETRDAIRRFQTYYGLPATGEINEQFLSQMVKVGGLQVH